MVAITTSIVYMPYTVTKMTPQHWNGECMFRTETKNKNIIKKSIIFMKIMHEIYPHFFLTITAFPLKYFYDSNYPLIILHYIVFSNNDKKNSLQYS